MLLFLSKETVSVPSEALCLPLQIISSSSFLHSTDNLCPEFCHHRFNFACFETSYKWNHAVYFEERKKSSLWHPGTDLTQPLGHGLLETGMVLTTKTCWPPIGCKWSHGASARLLFNHDELRKDKTTSWFCLSTQKTSRSPCKAQILTSGLIWVTAAAYKKQL